MAYLSSGSTYLPFGEASLAFKAQTLWVVPLEKLTHDEREFSIWRIDRGNQK